MDYFIIYLPAAAYNYNDDTDQQHATSYPSTYCTCKGQKYLRWHLLGIGQTKIIYYNLPDVTGNIDKKLNFIEYVPILIIPAYYK